MKFKTPGGELTFFSVFWIFASIGAIYLAVSKGQTVYYVLGAMIGIPAIGIWLDQRWCGYLMAALMLLSIPFAVYLLIAIDDTLNEKIHRIVRILLAGYCAAISYNWAKEE